MWLIRGVMRDYDWGAIDGLADWSHATGGPQAELWFGLHPSAPAPVLDAEGRPTGATLDEVMAPQRRPLLVKLLAAQRPLSIQVHPERARAVQLFDAGVLPDDQEKSEVLLALEPFRIHAGWRDLDTSLAVLRDAGVDLGDVRTHAEAARGVMSLGAEQAHAAIVRLPDAAQRGGIDVEAVESLRTIAVDFPDDPGVLVCVLLRHVVLEPGSTIGVPAGVIHSYVRGLGVEVMTSSDNVLRLGLTSKPVDVDATLSALSERPVGDGSGLPFVMSAVEDRTVSLDSGYRVVVPLEGSVEVIAPGDRVRAGVGLAVVIGEDEPAADAHIRGRAIVAEAR